MEMNDEGCTVEELQQYIISQGGRPSSADRLDYRVRKHLRTQASSPQAETTEALPGKRIPQSGDFYVDANNWRNTLEGVECIAGERRVISQRRVDEIPKASASCADLWRQSNARLFPERV